MLVRENRGTLPARTTQPSGHWLTARKELAAIQVQHNLPPSPVPPKLKATLKRRRDFLDVPRPESDGEDLLEEADGLGGDGYAVANDEIVQPEIGSEQVAYTRICIRNDQSQ
jgi:hypothetical protein